MLGPAFLGQVDDLRLYNRALTAGEVEDLAINYRSRAILSGVNGKRSKEQGEYLREYFLTYAAPEPLRALYGELEALQEAEGGRGEADSDCDGDVGTEEAPRDVRARARRLSEPHREGAARRTGDAASASRPVRRSTGSRWRNGSCNPGTRSPRAWR